MKKIIMLLLFVGIAVGARVHSVDAAPAVCYDQAQILQCPTTDITGRPIANDRCYVSTGGQFLEDMSCSLPQANGLNQGTPGGGGGTSGGTDPFQEICSQQADAEVCQDRGKGNVIYGQDGIITKITKLLSLAVGIASVIVIIVGGLQYVLSTGDPSKTAKAKNMILFAIVGIVIAVMAQSIVIYVLNKL